MKKIYGPTVKSILKNADGYNYDRCCSAMKDLYIRLELGGDEFEIMEAVKQVKAMAREAHKEALYDLRERRRELNECASKIELRHYPAIAVENERRLPKGI